MADLTSFCGQKNGYSVSKTLRFELKPQGKTKEWIEKNGLLESDNKKSEDYKEVKKIIDNYHRFFIDDILSKANLDWEPLKEAIVKYRKDKSEDEQLETIQNKLRNKVAKEFSDDERFSILTASTPKDLFVKLLPEYLPAISDSSLNEQALKTFEKFSTYFTGFQETRKNVYTSEAIATAVPYRIVHDNFPKFLQDIEAFLFYQNECPKIIEQVEEELKDFLVGKRLSDIFTVEAFNKVLSQKGIDFFNQIIGGISDKGGEKKYRGINEFANLYWQQNKDFDQNHRKVKMIPLFKQILSDRSTLSFVIESIENDKELAKAISDYYESLKTQKNIDGDKKSILEICSKLFTSLDEYSSENIFINKKDISNVSQVLFGNWSELQTRINAYAQANLKTKIEKSQWIRDINEENSSKKIKGEFSIADIDTVLGFSSDECEETTVRMIDYFTRRYQFKFDSVTGKLVKTEEVKYLSIEDQLSDIDARYSSIIPILENCSEDNTLKENIENTSKIKGFLDSVNELLHRIKPFNVSSEVERDSSFYEAYDTVYKNISEIISVYNKTRNYITKKSIDPGKYKLNFDNPTLADGWDANKEEANTCVLLLKDDKYFLAIMNAKNKPKFASLKNESSESSYKKMVYKLLPGPNKMLPKVFFSTKGIATYNPPKKILDGYNEGKHKKGSSFDLGFCHELIDYFKLAINQHPDWKKFNFVFSKTEEYKDISEFYKEISEQGYKLSFVDIPESVINEWVDTGKLYLFQIYNKDFASGANGTPNMHTLYWKNLFSPENLKDVVLKLNGEAELFYREVGIKKPVCHKVGEKMVNRTTKDGKSLPEEIHTEIFKYANGKLNGNLSDRAREYLDSGNVTIKEVEKNHEITKDKHFTEPKFLFHVPITINFKAAGNSFINENVRKFLRNNPDVNIIGLDRGERHLIYLSLINQKGEILEQRTLNTITRIKKTAENNKITVDYHEKLDQREKERDEARKNWQTIGKIAELKEGYLSAVISDLTHLMIENNAIIVMEDLNFGFKRGRFHVEKQVYQKFEHMLIDKLNYLVFKEKGLTEPGGVLNGYQLTQEFESFQKLGKQSGFLFYVPAGYTSKIDPITGFVNLLDLKNLTNVEKKRNFFSKFDSITFDEKSNMFAFTFDYNNFGGKGAEEMKRTKWTVYSNKERIKFCGKSKTVERPNLTEMLRKLFDDYRISYQNGENILDVIMEKGADDSSLKDRATIQFYDELYRLFTLILQMRNSDAKTGEDYIISPVKNTDGVFFDSRDYENVQNAKLPKDADANGAYHIALKGLYLLNQFNLINDDSKLKKVDMKISNKDWFAFRQK